MTTTTLAANLSPATDTHAQKREALAQKRLRVYKIFLYATIFNNALLGIYCLGFGGGATFEAVSAPSFAAPTLGALGVATVVSAIFALLWKRAGAVGIFLCGAAAVAVSLAVQLFVAASLFTLGTVFWVLIARHQWARLS